MSEKEQIKAIRTEIFSLAIHSPSLEVMHWYMWLDECFENDELHKEEVENVRWRVWVLQEKEEYVDYLLVLLRDLLTERGYIKEGEWISKSKREIEDESY